MDEVKTAIGILQGLPDDAAGRLKTIEAAEGVLLLALSKARAAVAAQRAARKAAKAAGGAA